MNKRFAYRVLCLFLCMFSRINAEDEIDFMLEKSLDHGVGVIKRITNNTPQEVLIRFADTCYPAIKPRSSTDDFGDEDKPQKLSHIFGATMLMGIIGLMAMKLNPQERLQKMQRRLNKPANEYTQKVDDEKDRLSNIDFGTSTPREQDQTVADNEELQARAKEEKKWTDFIDKQRNQEDAETEAKQKELKAKLEDKSLSPDQKKDLENQQKKLTDSINKRNAEREKAKNYQSNLSKAQTEGGLRNTLWADKQNTKYAWFNEKTDISREVNQWKGMRGLNTAQERAADKAFYEEGIEKMTPDEKKKAIELRKAEQAARKQIPIDKEAEKKKFWANARAQGGFIQDGKPMSKGQMVKTVLWNRAAGGGKKKKSSGEADERSHTARNLVLAGAAIGGIATGIAAVSEDMGSKVIENLIPWEIPNGKFRCPITKNPMLVGFGHTMIQNYTEGSILSLKRMMGVGAAWLQNPLPTPMSFTLKFKVRVLDAGGVHIVLREGLDFSAKDPNRFEFGTKVMLGIIDNSVTAISDKGTIVSQIKKDQYAAASIPPGIFTPYWLSYDRGFMMLGLGQPGTNVILSWNDPAPNPNLDRIGLSCDTAQVEFSEIFFSAPVVSQLSQKRYFFDGKERALESGTSWLGYSFREPGRGTISFQKKGGPAVVSLALSHEEDAPRIKFTLGSECDEPITICYKNSQTQELTEEQVGVISDPYPNNPNEFNTYWVSNLYGQFTVGHSQPKTNQIGQTTEPRPGENLIACVTMPDLAQAGTIGFGLHPDYQDTSTTIKNLTIHQAAELNEDLPPGYVERRRFSGPLKVVCPFSYLFRQADSSVEVHDTISGQTWYPAKTPQQQATYFFNAIISPDGTMSMSEYGNSKNPVKFGLGAAAMAIQQVSGVVNTTATQIGQSGVDVISQVITAAASIGLTGVAVGMNVSAGALSAEAKYGFRDQNAYVYTEKVTRESNTTTTVPAVVQQNQAAISKILSDAAGYKQSIKDRFDMVKMNLANAQMIAEGARQGRSMEDRHNEQLKFFELYVTAYKQIIPLINHPIIGNNPGMKKDIFNALFFINQAVRSLYTQPSDLPQKQIVTEAVINLFLAARQNAYLLNNRVSDDRNRAKLWSGWIQSLAGAALTSVPSQGFTLNPLFGEYLWLNDPNIFPSTQNGSLFFEAQGLGDIFVGIIDNPQDVRNTENDVYEVVFGGNNNTKSFMRVKSLGRSVAEVGTAENPDAAVTPMKKETFWVSLKDGTLSAGKGAWGEGKILEWTDPYPIPGARFVGLSTWNSPVTFNSIRIGPAVEDLTPALREEILNRKPEPATSAEEAKQKLMQDSFQDISEADTLTNDQLTQDDFVRNDALAFDSLMISDIDELTRDILQDNLDAAAGGDPRKKLAAAQAAAAAKKPAQKKDAKKDDKKEADAKTAAQQKQLAQQMASGGLGAFFQEKAQLFGNKKNDDGSDGKPGFFARARDAFRRATTKKTTATQSSP